MVVARTQEVSDGSPGRQYNEPEQPEVSLPAPPVPFPVSLSSPTQGDRVDALAVQVHSLVERSSTGSNRWRLRSKAPSPLFWMRGLLPLANSPHAGGLPTGKSPTYAPPPNVAIGRPPKDHSLPPIILTTPAGGDRGRKPSGDIVTAATNPNLWDHREKGPSMVVPPAELSGALRS